MIVVIQCAAKKRADAGFLRTKDGKPVLFVGDPAAAPPSREFIYARPDDPSDRDVSWRELLRTYNETPVVNPLELCRAADLYTNPAYGRLVKRFGAEDIYILSTGWGLIGSSFLTPNYDITFSTVKPHERYKRRKKGDLYWDFQALPAGTEEKIVFLGGKDYVPLFCQLTALVRGARTVFFNSEVAPEAPGCSLQRFATTTRTNWHYECANALLDGALAVGPNLGATRSSDDAG